MEGIKMIIIEILKALGVFVLMGLIEWGIVEVITIHGKHKRGHKDD